MVFNDHSFLLSELEEEISLFSAIDLFIILHFDLQQISLLPVIVPDWISWAFFEIVICLLMKGHWICLSTILLLSRLTEPPSFMVIWQFMLPWLFQGGIYASSSIFHWVRSLLDKEKIPVQLPEQTYWKRQNRKAAQNGPRVGFEI